MAFRVDPFRQDPRGFTAAEYPLDTRTMYGDLAFESGQRHPYYVRGSDMVQIISLGEVGAQTIVDLKGKPQDWFKYRVSQERTYIKNDDGDILREGGAEQHEERIVWHDPAGNLHYFFDGEKFVHIIYTHDPATGMEKRFYYTYEVPDEFFTMQPDEFAALDPDDLFEKVRPVMTHAGTPQAQTHQLERDEYIVVNPGGTGSLSFG